MNGDEMVKLDELKNVTKGHLRTLPFKRGGSRRSKAALEILEKEALTVDEVKDKLKIGYTPAYNLCRRLEKNGKIVAFEYNGKIHFIEKKTAEKEGLIKNTG